MISTVPPVHTKAVIGNMGLYTVKVTFEVSLEGFSDSFGNEVQDVDRFVASSANQVEGAS